MDISLCLGVKKGISCPLKDTCKRYFGHKKIGFQNFVGNVSYTEPPFVIHNKKPKCELYYPMLNESKED